jgi:uncharacterized protein YbaA (DUF1428 family)
MSYIDIFVLPIPAGKQDDYFAQARSMAPIWKEHGALSVVELRPDDVPAGTLTSFPRSVQAKSGEMVVVGLITYRDRAHRDAVMAAAMSDPRMETMMQNVPTDGKRMYFGGFVAEVEQ